MLILLLKAPSDQVIECEETGKRAEQRNDEPSECCRCDGIESDERERYRHSANQCWVEGEKRVVARNLFVCVRICCSAGDRIVIAANRDPKVVLAIPRHLLVQEVFVQVVLEEVVAELCLPRAPRDGVVRAHQPDALGADRLERDQHNRPERPDREEGLVVLTYAD